MVHDHNELGRHAQGWNLITDAAREMKLASVTAFFTVASLSHAGPANRSDRSSGMLGWLNSRVSSDPDDDRFWTKTPLEWSSIHSDGL